MNLSSTLTLASLAPALLLSLGMNTDAGAAEKKGLVYFGTYTEGKSKGIYVSRMNFETGEVSPPTLAAETESPSFLAIHPNHKFVYAANEISKFEGKDSGAISAFSVDPSTGILTFLNRKPSGGGGPCFVQVDKTGQAVLEANYGGGSISAFRIGSAGHLSDPSAFIQHHGSSMDPQRQKEPHAHSINVSPDNHYAFAADLGLDKIIGYKLDPAKGTLQLAENAGGTVAPGSGPRHLAFHPNGRFAYVINEMACTVTVFKYDAQRGALTQIQSAPTTPEKIKGNSTAEVQVHPSGKFLYGSNRGHDSIVVFAIDPKSGMLTYVENQSTQGKTPRNFGIDPSGHFLLAANQGSDTVVVFRIDGKTGRLTPTGQKLEVGAPVCVKFMVD